MEMRRLGRTDIEVSLLSLGTMMYGSQISEADALPLIDQAFDGGINFYDTAEMYSVPGDPATQGNSERILGHWLRSRNRRADVVIATKITGRSDMAWLRKGGEHPRLTPAQIHEAVDASLVRLGLDYIDLYQIHWPDRAVPTFGRDLYGYRHYPDDYAAFEDTLAEFEKLKDAGKVRAFGLSNETPWGVMRFLDAATRHGLPRMAAIQNAYSLVNRGFEYGLAEVALNEGIGLLAYSPLAMGLLSGKYIGGAVPKGSRVDFGNITRRYQTPNGEKAVKAYVDLARAHDLDPAQMALAFVNAQPWLASNIIGVTTAEQLSANLGSLKVKLSPELIKEINDIHATMPNPCP